MTKHVVYLLSFAVVLLGLPASVASAQDNGNREIPAVPANITVPAGHSVFLHGYAIGTQNFICLATSAGRSWRFTGPQATLFLTLRDEPYQQIATHFLSSNPGENGLPRPTWQHSLDSSAVWGRVAQSSSDPAYVEAGAIPWLLLEAAGARLGPTGGGLLAQTTYIQRLNTSGGLAPTTGCSQRTDIGAVALVPYTADYFFYKAEK